MTTSKVAMDQIWLEGMWISSELDRSGMNSKSLYEGGCWYTEFLLETENSVLMARCRCLLYLDKFISVVS